MATTKVTTKVLADDAVTIDKIADAAIVTESEGVSSNDNDTTLPTSAAVKDYVDTQDATKQDTITGAATTITSSDLTASKALISNASGKVAASSVTSTELGYVSGVTSSIQSQFNALTDNDTTYTISAVDSGDDAIIRLTDSNATTDDVTLVAGSNITLTPSGDNITIASTASGSVSEAFKTIAVSGQDSVVADTATDTLTLAAGSNITLTTNATTDTVTIASTGGSSGNTVIETDPHTGDGTTTAFSLTTSVSDSDAVQVYLNGVYQVKDSANYSISGSTITFVTPPVNGTAIELVHFVTATTSATAIEWQSSVKTASFTAAANEGYFVDSGSAAITVTLPSSPSVGDEVGLVDYGANAATNNITITSSDDIENSADDKVINYDKGAVNLVYSGATKGWLVSSAANETSTALGQVAIPVDYLVVAGGGGAAAGGGGAGGYRTSFGDASVSALTLYVSTNYTVSVGGGGNGDVANSQASTPEDGTDSTFATITSTGGGAGGINHTGTGGNGGSGGGGGHSGSNTNSGGSGNAGSYTPSEGNSGGSNGSTASPYPSGGGGGANASGGDGSGSTSGNGGDGKSNSITGSSVTYAGGGGGGTYLSSGTGGTGGAGGGGNGSSTGAGASGTANTGGGGGGAHGTTTVNGGDGGSGIVILRYPDTYTITIPGGSGLITGQLNTAVGSNEKYTTFTGGTGTISFS